MQLIKNHTAWLVTVLAVCLGGKHLHYADGDPLISAVAGLDPAAVLNALAALGDLQLAACDHFCRPRRTRRHEDRRIVDDRSVFLVRRADIDLGVQFAVGKQVIEPQRGRKLAFAVFLGDLKIEIPIFSQPFGAGWGREVLGVRFGHLRPVEFHQCAALPVIQVEKFAGIGRRQPADKVADKLSGLLIVSLSHCLRSCSRRCPDGGGAFR